MTSEVTVRVENLSKRYRLGSQWTKRAARYRTLSDTLAGSLSSAAHWLRHGPDKTRSEREEFWALRDVSFEIRQGEVVGIIGRNGAGKSTLLKILSRITEPTAGRVTIRGRVASLLEVGTGFHTELTGRENISLNGAILGMSRAEIKAKFDEIVAFAEVEKFLDTPVKRYSSGMSVRLAFAVAAHLAPEILIVDEVLAVGDAEFQQKCLGKMESVARHEGRTVLFVSHNMAAIRSLCSVGIVLKQGQVILQSDATTAVSAYLTSGDSRGACIEWEADRAPRADYIRFCKAYVCSEGGSQILDIDAEEPFVLCVEYELLKDTPDLRISFLMQSADGTLICSAHDGEKSQGRTTRSGVRVSRCRFPGRVLNSGTFFVGFGAETPGHDNPAVMTDASLFFRIEDNGNPLQEHRPGLVRPPLQWE